MVEQVERQLDKGVNPQGNAHLRMAARIGIRPHDDRQRMVAGAAFVAARRRAHNFRFATLARLQRHLGPPLGRPTFFQPAVDPQSQSSPARPVVDQLHGDYGCGAGFHRNDTLGEGRHQIFVRVVIDGRSQFKIGRAHV